jgi:hypothetical protein
MSNDKNRSDEEPNCQDSDDPARGSDRNDHGGEPAESSEQAGDSVTKSDR